MQWHPEKKIIAVGWRSGEVTTYNDHDHDFFEQSSIHRSPLSFLRWNQSGTQLVSGDKVRLKLYTAGSDGGEGGQRKEGIFVGGQDLHTHAVSQGTSHMITLVISPPCTHTHYLEWSACGVEGGHPWAAPPLSPPPTSSPFSPHTLHHAPPSRLTQVSGNAHPCSK